MSVIMDMLKALGKQSPIFHSEADFQHALASEVHQRFLGASVRLERPLTTASGQLHLDVLLMREADILAIELKSTIRAACHCGWGGEQFALKEQSAQDPGRYDFIKDIERLEHS